jgi:hypothetical protein
MDGFDGTLGGLRSQVDGGMTETRSPWLPVLGHPFAVATEAFEVRLEVVFCFCCRSCVMKNFRRILYYSAISTISTIFIIHNGLLIDYWPNEMASPPPVSMTGDSKPSSSKFEYTPVEPGHIRLIHLNHDPHRLLTPLSQTLNHTPR